MVSKTTLGFFDGDDPLGRMRRELGLDNMDRYLSSTRRAIAQLDAANRNSAVAKARAAFDSSFRPVMESFRPILESHKKLMEALASTEKVHEYVHSLDTGLTDLQNILESSMIRPLSTQPLRYTVNPTEVFNDWRGWDPEEPDPATVDLLATLDGAVVMAAVHEDDLNDEQRAKVEAVRQFLRDEGWSTDGDSTEGAAV